MVFYPSSVETDRDRDRSLARMIGQIRSMNIIHTDDPWCFLFFMIANIRALDLMASAEIVLALDF